MEQDPSITQTPSGLDALPADDPRRQPRSGAPKLGGAVPRGAVPSMKCVATNRQGKRCGRWAIVGGTVCPTHGGAAPQVREAARHRLLAFAPRAIQELERLATGAESEAVRVRAIIDILDRAGLKVAEELAVVPQEATNRQLDEAIAAALLARGVNVSAPDPLDDLDADSWEDEDQAGDQGDDILGPLD